MFSTLQEKAQFSAVNKHCSLYFRDELQKVPRYVGRVAIFAMQFDGSGDIVGGHLIAQIAARLMPLAGLTFSVLTPNYSAREKEMMAVQTNRQPIDWKSLPPIPNTTFVDQETVLKKVAAFGKVFIYPTYHDSLIPPAIRSIPHVKLQEYACEKIPPGLSIGPTYTLGVAKKRGEKGLLLPKELHAYYLQRRNDSPLQRLSHLQDVDPLLVETILGAKYSEPALTTFNDTNKLYFGYSLREKHQAIFLRTICQGQGDVTVCFANDRPDLEEMSLCPSFFELNGFKNVSLLCNQKAKFVSFYCKKYPKGTRTLRVLFAPLPHEQFVALLKASEKKGLFANHSFLEGLALGKWPSFTLRDYTVDFGVDMVEAVGAIHPKFKPLLSRAFFGTDKPGRGPLDLIQLQRGMESFYAALDQNLTLQAEWDQTITTLFEKHDFEPAFRRILHDHL